MPEFTFAQKQAVAQYLLDMSEALATAAPSLDPDFEKVQDMGKAMIAGVKLGVSLMFGKEAADGLTDRESPRAVESPGLADRNARPTWRRRSLPG